MTLPPLTLSPLESAPADLAAMTTHPTILYSLYYDIQRTLLSVHLKQLFNLPTRGKHKTVDSYVELCLLSHQDEVMRSKVVVDSLNPIFEHQFEFVGQPGMHILKKQTLVFRIFGYNK